MILLRSASSRAMQSTQAMRMGLSGWVSIVEMASVSSSGAPGMTQPIAPVSENESMLEDQAGERRRRAAGWSRDASAQRAREEGVRKGAR